MSHTIRVRDEDYERLKRISRREGLTLPQSAARAFQWSDFYRDVSQLDEPELDRLTERVAERLIERSEEEPGTGSGTSRVEVPDADSDAWDP